MLVSNQTVNAYAVANKLLQGVLAQAELEEILASGILTQEQIAAAYTQAMADKWDLIV